MSSAKCAGIDVLTLLVLTCCTAQLTFAQDHYIDNLDITARANLSGTPMVGVDYALSEQASIRFALGYYTFEEITGPCEFSVPCVELAVVAPVREYSGSIAGIYRLTEGALISPYMGGELQYLYAASRVLKDLDYYTKPSEGRRLSMSGIFGLSLRPVSWLSLFGEVGVGHVRGLSVRAFRADLNSNVNRWGITHVSPGVRISL